MAHSLQDLVITLISLLSFPYTLLFGKLSSVRLPNGVATLLHLHVLFLTGASLPTQTHPTCWRKICFCQKKKLPLKSLLSPCPLAHSKQNWVLPCLHHPSVLCRADHVDLWFLLSSASPTRSQAHSDWTQCLIEYSNSNAKRRDCHITCIVKYFLKEGRRGGRKFGGRVSKQTQRGNTHWGFCSVPRSHSLCSLVLSA